MEKDLKKISKYLSYILRHQPEEIGLELDNGGWAHLNDLIAKTTDLELSANIIKIVVEKNDKQRFSLSEDGLQIRANQGHAIDIDLELPALNPPEILLHGTAERFWPSIESNGLIKGNRHHVHLTELAQVANSVGSRYGKPLLLEIAAGAMAKAGYLFFKSTNNVWLVDHVPPSYLKIH